VPLHALNAERRISREEEQKEFEGVNKHQKITQKNTWNWKGINEERGYKK
jgi:hypothetical protein